MYNSQNIQVALSNLQNEKVNTKDNRTGFYRAIVINNKDPYNIARVKVRIPALHGTSSAQSFYVEDNYLPYAWPANFNGANYHSGQYIIPLEGSIVWVSFETGTDNLIYFGSPYSVAPEAEKLMYFDRSTNGGNTKTIEGDDIPSDYDTNKYVLYRSPKGACIYIDDRDINENISIIDSHGNSIVLNKSGIIINASNITANNLPYYNAYYIKKSDITDDAIQEIAISKVYEDPELTKNASRVINGSRLLYVNNSGKVLGFGIVTYSTYTSITISNNGSY